MASQSTIAVPFNDLARQHEPLAGELRAAFDRLLDSSAFILGREVEQFEEEFARFCQTEHCVGLASGTAALTLMLQGAGIGQGDEVIVPAHTFIATALAVLHAGAEPVCVEVEAGTGLIDPGAVRAAVGPRTAAVIAVHLYGQVCQMAELEAVCQAHGLALFEDAAQAQAASYQGRPAGGLARAGAFSFYPSKNLGALGDAGALCTDDRELAERVRGLRDLGRSAGGRHELVGYNERLDGLQAAMLRVKLGHVEGWNRSRRRMAERYRQQLVPVADSSDAALLLEERPESPCIYHLFPIRVPDRDTVASRLSDRGIATGVHYPVAVPDHPALGHLKPVDVPVARDWAARELSLPMFPELRDDEVDAVAEALGASVA
jgi:dTDP-3-amino-3,4,6-trideoxy-alpha-D-glucose transaminase